MRSLRWIQNTSQTYVGPFWQKGDEPVPGLRLEQPLGRGGFGEVWRAVDPEGNRVAIKFVSWNEKLAEAEWNAISKIREIRHPNLIGILGLWRTEKALVVAMELADSCLWTCWQQERRTGRLALPEAKVREWFVQAAQGIDALHKVGFDHRDIKPSNLLLVNGVVKVADFGLAKIRERSLATHSSALSIAYAAPEYFDGKSAKTSDQYCLAVTWCQMRGGFLPFEGTPAKTVIGHLRGKPDLSMIPPTERPALAKALAKDPKERWESCSQFVANIGKPVKQRMLSRRQWVVGGLGALPLLGYLGYRIGYSNASNEIEVLNKTSLPSGYNSPRMIRSGFFHPENRGPLVDGSGKEFFFGVAGTKGVVLFRLDTMEVVRKVGLGSSACMAFHPLEIPVFYCADNDGGTMEYHLIKEKPNQVLKRNNLDINDIATTFDGKYIYLASCDSSIYKYNLGTSTLAETLMGSRGIVYSLGLNFSGKRMLSGGLDGQVVLWDLIGGKKVNERDYHDSIVYNIYPLSVNYEAVTVGRDRKVNLVDFEEGKLVRKFATMPGGVFGSMLLPNERIGVGSEDKIYVFDATGKEVVRAALPHGQMSCLTDVTNVSANVEYRKKYNRHFLVYSDLDSSVWHCKMPEY